MKCRKDGSNRQDRRFFKDALTFCYVFKDYDKYLILVYLFQKTFNSYADYFIKNTYEDFYSKDSFEIVKFNIIDVSRNLLIKKETARRKLIELENDDVIQKNKKVVKLNQKAINIITNREYITFF